MLKYNVVLVSIIQVQLLLRNNLVTFQRKSNYPGKAIFDNSSYYLVMGLRKQAVEDLSLLIDLNENEKDSIKRYSQGEGFVCLW